MEGPQVSPNALEAKWKARYTQAAYKYGLEPQEYRDMAEARCELCGKRPRKLGGINYIDHCHKTGKIRGTLCNGCNAMLGLAKDDIKMLKRAIKYLQKHSR